MSAHLTSRRRTSKACATCRLRKTRCDGELPCSFCRLRDIKCSYRKINRVRNRVSLHTKSPSGSTSESTADQDPKNETDPAESSVAETLPSEIVHPIITAAQTGLPTEVSQLYYGACSHFSSLQQIHRSVTIDSDQTQFSAGAGDDWQAGLDIYGHCELFFGSSRNSNGTRLPGVDRELAFLSYDLAQRFLQCYFQGIHQVFPFWSAKDLEGMLDGLYGRIPNVNLQQTDRIIILTSLAIGATSTEHSYWAEALYERSKSESDLRSDIVNISTVQIQLLLISNPSRPIHYQIVCGRPNLSYLQLGSAARLAFAAGMHRDIDYPSHSMHPGSAAKRCEERRVTFWSMAFFERWTSYSMGRPNAISATDSSCPHPERQPFISILAQLSEIMLKSKNDIYGQQQISLPSLRKSAQNIFSDLQGFTAKVQNLMNFDLNSTPCFPGVDIKHVYLINFYNHTVLTTFKPFLTIYRSWQKNRHVEENSSQLAFQSDSWLSLACRVTVKAAVRLISFTKNASRIDPDVRTQRYFCWYIVNACFILLEDILRDSENTNAHLQLIDQAMGFLLALPHADVVSRMMLVISRLRHKVVEQLEITETGPHIPREDYLQPQYSRQLGLPPQSTPVAAFQPAVAPILESDMIGRSDLEDTTNGLAEENNGGFNFDVLAADFGNLFDFSTMDISSMEDILNTETDWRYRNQFNYESSGVHS